MKKKELTKLINNKKLLKETIEIMDEIGGYDNQEIKVHDTHKGLQDLTTIFETIDSTSHRLVDLLKGGLINDPEGDKEVNVILQNYFTFMESLNNYLQNKAESHNQETDELKNKTGDHIPTPLNVNQLGDPMAHPRLNENKKIRK